MCRDQLRARASPGHPRRKQQPIIPGALPADRQVPGGDGASSSHRLVHAYRSEGDRLVLSGVGPVVVALLRRAHLRPLGMKDIAVLRARHQDPLDVRARPVQPVYLPETPYADRRSPFNVSGVGGNWAHVTWSGSRPAKTDRRRSPTSPMPDGPPRQNTWGTWPTVTGKNLQWDAARMRATNAPEADRFIRRNYRKGWRGFCRSARNPVPTMEEATEHTGTREQ